MQGRGKKIARPRKNNPKASGFSKRHRAIYKTASHDLQNRIVRLSELHRATFRTASHDFQNRITQFLKPHHATFKTASRDFQNRVLQIPVQHAASNRAQPPPRKNTGKFCTSDTGMTTGDGGLKAQRAHSPGQSEAAPWVSGDTSHTCALKGQKRLMTATDWLDGAPDKRE
ncbi:MAG: hypothetical protein J6K41_02050 [Paraprevotella sp.]|nr:hypothetical protein [Paraprevotella sp.]